MRVRGPSLILFVVVGAILPATVAGCAAARVGSPSEQEYAAARGGRAAVVLLRAVAETRKGGERTAFGRESGRGKAVSLVRLETGGNTKSVGPLRSPHARNAARITSVSVAVRKRWPFASSSARSSR